MFFFVIQLFCYFVILLVDTYQPVNYMAHFFRHGNTQSLPLKVKGGNCKNSKTVDDMKLNRWSCFDNFARNIMALVFHRPGSIFH